MSKIINYTPARGQTFSNNYRMNDGKWEVQVCKEGPWVSPRHAGMIVSFIAGVVSRGELVPVQPTTVRTFKHKHKPDTYRLDPDGKVFVTSPPGHVPVKIEYMTVGVLEAYVKDGILEETTKVEPAKPAVPTKVRYIRPKADTGQTDASIFYDGSHHMRIEADGTVIDVMPDGSERKSSTTASSIESHLGKGQWVEVNASSSAKLIRSCRYAAKYLDGEKAGQKIGNEEGYKVGYEQATKDFQNKAKGLVDEVRAIVARLNDRITADFKSA